MIHRVGRDESGPKMTTLTMRRIRNVFETSALMRVMSAMLATQFESFAECCLELARALERWDRGDTFFAMNAVNA